MKAPQKRTLIAEEESQTGIVIDATVEEMTTYPASIAKICWNTGEEKNCPACYLSKGCKAK
jgi:hypothetical protein